MNNSKSTSTTLLRYLCGVICILGMLLAQGCMVTQSQNTPVSHKLEKTADGSEYYIYVPSTYDSTKKIPLVMTLHGTPPWDVGWMQIREWKALAEEKQFIVVAPLMDSTQGILPVIDSIWRKDLKRDEKVILSVRREMCEKYNIDEKTILLSGFSAGGYPMYYTGLRHPEKFGMLVARACNADMRCFENLPYKESDKKTYRIPVWLFFGKDDLGPIQKQSWMAYRWLRRHGWTKANCQMEETKGGHIRRPATTWQYWHDVLGVKDKQQ